VRGSGQNVRRRRCGQVPRAPRADGRERAARRERVPSAPRALPRPACPRLRPGRQARPDLRAGARRRQDVRVKTAVDIRRLLIAPPGRTEGIGRRAYRTRWSRSMSAGEPAKPASICLGAFEDDELAGYLIISRYANAWHVMNIAVDPDFRRRGIATALLEKLFALTGDSVQRGYTLEVRVSNEGAIKLYERL